VKNWIRSVCLLAAIAAAAFGQTPAPASLPAQCYSGAQIVQPCARVTDDIYWASKDQRVRDLQKITDPAARESAAEALDAAGLVIDRQIDIWGWDPTLVMETRGEYGYPWVPSAFQPNLIDPLKTGVVPAGATATDMSKPWPRSVKVSTLESDYPPINPPKPAAPPSDGVTWYFDSTTGAYSVLLSAVTGQDGKFVYTEGQQLLYGGQTVYFHVNWTVFGPYPQFLLNKPK
jgi:hypothetical protein